MDTSSSQGARAAAPPALCDASAVLADLEAAKRQVGTLRRRCPGAVCRAALPDPQLALTSPYSPDPEARALGRCPPH